MEMIIERGTENDIEELGRLYDDLIDDLDAHINYPGWRKGIYPTVEDAEAGVKEGSLYVVRSGGRIMGTVILNHDQEKAYADVDWHVDLDDQDIFVIHTFAVHPLGQGQGLGKRIMDFALERSVECGMKAIRLDVYQKNAPAISLYKRCGFEYMGSVDLGYGCYGLDQFELYQKVL